MSLADFRKALDLARKGVTVTDLGADMATQAALLAVAQAAPHPPSALVRAARTAWRDSKGKRTRWLPKV